VYTTSAPCTVAVVGYGLPIITKLPAGTLIVTDGCRATRAKLIEFGLAKFTQ
jgi:hypothetical protein